MTSRSEYYDSILWSEDRINDLTYEEELYTLQYEYYQYELQLEQQEIENGQRND